MSASYSAQSLSLFHHFWPPSSEEAVGTWYNVETYLSHIIQSCLNLICNRILSFNKASEVLTRLLGWTRLVGWTRLIRWGNRRRKAYNLGIICRMLKHNSGCSHYQSSIRFDEKYNIYSLVETEFTVHIPFVTSKHDLLSILQYMLRHSYSFSFQVAIAREYQIYLLSLHHTEIFVQPIKCRNRSINYVNRMVSRILMYFV